jgi:hypothetical protein
MGIWDVPSAKVIFFFFANDNSSGNLLIEVHYPKDPPKGGMIYHY